MFRATSMLPITALVLLVALTGCTPGTSPIPETDSDVSAREVGEVVTPDWTIEASLVGDPVAADGVVLAYTRASSGSLQVEAWDATTGEQLWADAAVTGATTPGVVVTANIITEGDSNYAVYLRQGDDNDWQDLVLADLATGAPVALTDNRVWATSRPSSCADGTGICFTGWKQSAYEAGLLNYRFNTAGGDISPDTDVILPDSARLLGHRVYSTSGRAPDGTETLGGSADGQLLWERPYTDVFGEGASSDAGWSWDDADPDEVLLGVGYRYASAAPDAVEVTRDATLRRVVALDATSGDTVWSVDGADFCDRDLRTQDRADGQRTLCRYNAGTTTFTQTGDGTDGTDFDAVSTGFDVDLIGVDLATGDIEWTLPLGSEGFEGDSDESTFASFSPERVMLVDGEPAVVNLLTGEQTAPAQDAVYACSTTREPLLTAYPRSGASTPFSTGDDYAGCDATGTATDTFSIGSVRMVGVNAGAGRAVVASPGALLGFAIED